MVPFGPTELLLILVIVLIIFGAGKLPQVLGSLGKGVREFRDASEGKDAIPPGNNTTQATTTTTTPSATTAGATTDAASPSATNEKG